MKNDKRDSKFPRDLIKGLGKPQLIEVAKETAEGALDAFLGDGAIQMIPGVKVLEYLARLPSNISNELFKQAVLSFLEAGEDADLDQWNTLVDELEQKEGQLDRAGELIIRFLANTDDTKKAKYLGKLYAAAARNIITIQELYRMQMILDRIYLPDLEGLPRFINYGEFEYPIGGYLLETLQVLVVVSEDFGQPYDDRIGADVRYQVTRLGRNLLRAIGLVD